PIDGASIETGRGAGLQAATAQAEFLQRFSEQDGGGFAGASGGILLFAAMDEPVEKCAGGDDDSIGADGAAVAQTNTITASACRAGMLPARYFLDHQVRHFALLDLALSLPFHHFS